MAARRPLRLANPSEIMPDVDRLLAGHETVGRWSLGQICNHLALTLRYTVEGFPDRVPWPLRLVIAPFARRQVLKAGRMPEGFKVPDHYLPRPGLDARAEAEALCAMLQLYQSNPGPFGPHPILGTLSRADWDRYHAVHAAHHLSFAVPAG